MRVRNLILAPVGAASLGAVGLVLAAPALAHDELIGSSPVDGSTISRRPASVTLYFEEAPESSPVQMVVRGPDGVKINSTGPRVDGANITEQLGGSKAAGTYSVVYRIMSDDGHPVSGTVRFTVDPQAGAAAPAAAPVRPRTARTSTWLAVGAGALAGGAVALGVAVALRRRRRPPVTEGAQPVPDEQPSRAEQAVPS
jgi:methionine-rich copper-binding protein CopC